MTKPRRILIELPPDSPEELSAVAQSVWKHLENSNISGTRVTPVDKLSGMRIYTSKRDHTLLYTGEPGTAPILTAENYTKWYELYLVQPDGSVTEVPVEVIELVQDKHPDARWQDHLYHPRLIYWLAEELGAELDERLEEVAAGRWIYESGDMQWPVELFSDPRQ